MAMGGPSQGDNEDTDNSENQVAQQELDSTQNNLQINEIPKHLREPPCYIKRKVQVNRTLKPELFTNLQAQPVEKKITNEKAEAFFVHDANGKIHPDFEKEYDKIFKPPTPSLHKILIQNGDYIWTATIGSISYITKNALDKTKSDLYPEEDFVLEILEEFNSRPIAIASHPGMGKSMLLASLAKQLKETYPTRIVIFLQIRTLIKHMSHVNKAVNLDNAREIISQSCTSNECTKSDLLKKMEGKLSQFEIFFDGFDEIDDQHLKEFKELLMRLRESGNMRAYITSRSHMRQELQDTLGVISYDIVPFSKEDQIFFLCETWNAKLVIDNVEQHDNEKLKEIAEECLKLLVPPEKNKDFDNELAGIPLQCYLLAEVHYKEVKNMIEINMENITFSNQATTLFELFANFMKFKFKNVQNENKEQMRHVHWREALNCLWPEKPELSVLMEPCSEQVKRHEQKEKVKREVENETCNEQKMKMDEEKLRRDVLAVGIMLEFQKGAAGESSEFLHRTFAEYLATECLVFHIVTGHPKSVSLQKFIFGDLLSTTEYSNDEWTFEDVITKVRKIGKSWLKDKQPQELLKLLHLDTTDLERISLKNLAVNSDMLFQMFEPLHRVWETVIRDHESTNCGIWGTEFRHPTICYYLNAHLEKFKIQLFRRQRFKNWTTSDDTKAPIDYHQLMTRLDNCTRQSFDSLLNFVGYLGLEFGITANTYKTIQQIQTYSTCGKLLQMGTLYGNVGTFMAVANVVNASDNLITHLEYSDQRCFDNYKRIFRRTSLDDEVEKGRRDLKQYLKKQYSDRFPNMSELLYFCLFGSSKDSTETKDKLEAIYILQNMCNEYFKNVIARRVELYHCFIDELCHWNVFTIWVGPFTTFEKEVLIHREGNKIEMPTTEKKLSIFVNDLLDRGYDFLLHLKPKGESSSILEAAIENNILSTNQFVKIYKSYPFELEPYVKCALKSNFPVDMFKTLVELSKNQPNPILRKWAPLHWAAHYASPALINHELVAGKVYVNVKDIDGNTPLHLACMNVSKFTISCVNLLLSHGALVTIKNKEGKTPFSFVEFNCQSEIFELVKPIFDKEQELKILEYEGILGTQGLVLGTVLRSKSF